MQPHLDQALSWIQRAHLVAEGGGISKGYDLLRRRWASAYPETTGYTIPTLLNASVALGRADLRVLALKLAEYLLARTTPEGGVAHWRGSTLQPIVFDTGQVIFGWLAAGDAGGDPRFLRAAARAADWLVSVQDPSGAWVDHQHLGVTKVIDTRVAWALIVLSHRIGEDAYRRAGVSNLEWALRQQDATGWFRHCAFTDAEDPYTHTLAYTAEGLFEGGRLLGEPMFVDAARRTADALLARQRPDGSLASTYAAGWRATTRSSCLTGDCQMACLWLRLHHAEGELRYLEAAGRAVDFVARTQNLRTSNPNIRGAIAGSHPVYGRYERLKYPNWAAKFFVDALLLHRAKGERVPGAYMG